MGIFFNSFGIILGIVSEILYVYSTRKQEINKLQNMVEKFSIIGILGNIICLFFGLMPLLIRL